METDVTKPALDDRTNLEILTEHEHHSDGSRSETGSGSGSGSDSDSGSGSESDVGPVLAVTRERRANAGSRMAQLLKLAGDEDAALGATGEEDTEDQYADIFQEAADDREFEEGRDDDADVDMSSSSDEEDAAQDGDEEAGERELRKEKMKDRGKKRKKMSLLQQTMKLKKLKYAPILPQPQELDATKTTNTAAPAATQAAPRPKKKIERVTWLPDIAGTRSSMRKATVHNKQATHKRLKEHEKKRKQTIAQLQAAEDRRKAKEAPPMTQEERLARAAEVERINLTSVNSWEAIEQQRQEERNAKLAALKNRKLEGPVITFWSGPATWVNGKLRQVGKPRLVEDLDVESPTKDEPEQADADATESLVLDEAEAKQPSGLDVDGQTIDLEQHKPDDQPSKMDVDPPLEKAKSEQPESEQARSEPMELDQAPSDTQKVDLPLSPSTNEIGLLDGIEYWASLPETESSTVAPGPAAVSEPQAQEHMPATVLSPSPAASWRPLTMPSATPVVLPLHSTQTEIRIAEEQNRHLLNALPGTDIDMGPELHELAARSLITLTSFNKLEQRARRYEPAPTGEDEMGTAITGGRWGGTRVSAAEKDRELLLRTLFSIPPDMSNLSLEEQASSTKTQGYDPLIPASVHPRHNARYLSKRAQHCAITGQVARYRDPATGLPYASAAAYKSVKKVLSGQGAWSSLLQCWIGEVKPAKGVPESVWFGTKPGEEKKTKEDDAGGSGSNGAAAEKSDQQDEVMGNTTVG